MISVIIVTLNEVENIRKTIRTVRNSALLSSGKSLPIEIIVSDGGSIDGTLKIAEEFADKVVLSQKGRYIQLNEGAKVSNGEILLFLHADLVLPRGAILRIVKSFQDSQVLGGAFKKSWNWSPNVTLSKFLKRASSFWQGFGNWLTHLIKEFPGDNAFFIRRDIFYRLNGFSPMWICEDFDLSRRLLKYSKKIEKSYFKKISYKKKIAYIRSPVKSSTRRFETYGFFKSVYFWFKIYWLWRAGFSQDQLKNAVPSYKAIPKYTKRSILRF
jgi:glycosyltransferase involved in cell wall biosynthesis